MARLIIVEDNTELAFLIVSAARARGHQATAMGVGHAALSALGGGATFDAAVVDLLLPDMGGGEVLAALREAGIPAVAISGVYKGETFAREAIEKHGATRFFEKPFDMKSLLEALESAAAGAGALPAMLIEDDEEELEELAPLEEVEVEDDEPLVADAVVEGEATVDPGEMIAEIEAVEAPPAPAEEPPTRPEMVPELDEEPGTPTRPLDGEDLAALAQLSSAEAAAATVSPEEETAEVEEEIPTRVAGPPLDIRLAPQDEGSPEEDMVRALEMLEAMEAMEAPMSMAAAAKESPPPPPEQAPRPARGPGGAIGMAHELAVRVSHKPPEKVAPPPAEAETGGALESLAAAESGGEAPPEREPVDTEAALAGLAEEAPAVAATPEPPPEAPAPDAVLVPFGERGRVWNPEPQVRKRPLPEWGEAGDLSRSPVPRLLNAFYEARHTGELKLKQDTVVKVVTVENGLPVYAASNLASERFGRFCVRRGAVTEADLNRVAALAELEGIRTGESMVRLGLVTADRRRELLEEQVREIIWSTFSWTRGQYHLVPKKPSRQDLVKLFLFPGELILEGVSRTHTLISLRQKMPPQRRLSHAPDPPYVLQEIPLTGPQQALLAAADGSKAVEDLLALTDLSEREALASLAGFELLGLLVERPEENKRQRISFGL